MRHSTNNKPSAGSEPESRPWLRHRRFWGPLIVLVGIGLSYNAYRELSQEALNRWQAQGARDITRITDIALDRLQAVDGPVMGLAMLYRGSEEVTHAEFLEALSLTQSGEQRFNDIGYAYVEADPEAHVRIRQSSEDDPYLAPGRDLNIDRPFQATLVRLRARPEKIQMGPVFADADGHYKALFGLLVGRSGRTAAVLALVDMSTLFQDLTALHNPEGLFLFPETEGLAPDGILPLSTAEGYPLIASQLVRVRSGGADWRFHWEMHGNYQGGPGTRLAWAVLVGGSIISLLLALVVDMLLQQHRRDREAELAQSGP